MIGLRQTSFQRFLIGTIVVPVALAVVFVADAVTPLGVTSWLFYLIPVCIALFADSPRLPLLTAASTSILLVVGFFLSPAGADPGIAIVNRSIGFVVIWFLAVTVYRYTVSRLAVQRSVWLQQSQVRIHQAVRNPQSAGNVGDALVRALAQTLGAHVGAVYECDGGSLRRLAGWALPQSTPDVLASGQTIAGQAAAEGRVIAIGGLPADYLPVSSALGRTGAGEIIAAPLLAEGETVGVVELGFVGMERDTADVVELFERLGEPIGMLLRAALYRRRLETLLTETQRQSEELQVQQEELRVSNEELEERGRALMESQARLEAQQAELEQTNVQLEEHAQRLEAQKREMLAFQAELAANARALERSNQYKSEFLANMSHELRTPLNSALILAKLLQENKPGTLNEEQVRYAATIHAANTDLLNLINDILDLSKIEAGHLTIEPEEVDVETFVRTLEHMFQPVAAQKRLAMRVETMPGTPPTIVTDSQRLQQVLKNLLSNAFKFTEQGSVTLAIAAQGDDTVRFEVRDTGIGIPRDKQQVIFEAFQQADGTTSRRFGGTGLGLSISRELTRLLGGTIAVASEPGQGSVFALTLPRVLGADDETRRAGLVTTGVPFVPVSRAAPAAPAAASAAAPTASRVPAPAMPGPALDMPANGSPGALTAGSTPGNPHWPAPIADDRERRSRGSRLILVVEDDLAFADILYNLAHELDFDCIHATTSGAGLELAREHQPCGILLDVALPDQSGLTLLDWLKHDPATRHIPTHLISVSDHAEAALHRGAIGYTFKPSGRDQLAAAIRGLEARMVQGMRHVLVVEDDAVLRESIRALLNSLEVEIVTADSIAEAAAALSRQRFDCVVMDMALPDGTGHDLLARMAEDAGDDAQAMPPVIVYTGRQLSAEDEQRLRRHSKSIIIKGARSPERLLDEVTLFLHSVESALPPEQQRMLRDARSRDDAFDGRKVLLAEDDARNIFALSRVLEPLGATVEIARSGREALDKLAEQGDVDLVLMDVMMPEMDGITAMRAIRAMPQHGRLPIIALTAKAMPSDREACLQAGANDYIAKPIDVDKLLSLCRVWLHAS
ncbi:response regulator [Cupriavidus plantarum]|uniref:Virulence sensor protein BvgS n=2 Tax=Cupriavidus plantarum TaxID=942865 RepID=A0A316EL29_9BURK|nr:response regulator [Cupriavidus plantarum]PWK31273.1 signal transduction histidine kinase [Cupriavidus plantarum]